MLYTIVWNMPGCLPEMDPYTIEAINLADAISTVRDEVERMCDEDYDVLDNGPGETVNPKVIEWESLINEINDDFENAANLAEKGVTYHMPNGYVIEAIMYPVTVGESVIEGNVGGVITDIDDTGVQVKWDNGSESEYSLAEIAEMKRNQ